MSFSKLGLSPSLFLPLARLGYERPTPIQAEAIPAVLTGTDLLARAQTGTGKTAAFGLPMMERIVAKREADQARAVSEFMREVLTSVEPENRGADVRLIDVLSAASGSAAQRFAGHPLQEAQVRDLLGEVYNNLSLFPDSKAEYQRSLALWQQHAGMDDPRALTAELHCAGVALNENFSAGIASAILTSVDFWHAHSLRKSPLSDAAP